MADRPFSNLVHRAFHDQVVAYLRTQLAAALKEKQRLEGEIVKGIDKFNEQVDLANAALTRAETAERQAIEYDTVCEELRASEENAGSIASNNFALRGELAAEQRAHAETRAEYHRQEALRIQFEDEKLRAEAELDRARPVLEACAALDLSEAKLDEDGLTATEVEAIVEAELARRAKEPT